MSEVGDTAGPEALDGDSTKIDALTSVSVSEMAANEALAVGS